jgi:hypothetical protein
MMTANYDCTGVSQKLPDNFTAEIAAIQAGARNGGIIRPRRRAGLLIELDRVKAKYDGKIEKLRARGLLQGVDAAEAAINKAAAEFTAGLPTAAAG